MLGGVEIEDAEKGLAGHSDADVLTHAIIDALLGAAGLGDIGQHFPDTDEAWKGADSMGLLERRLHVPRGPRLDGAPRRLHADLRGAEDGAVSRRHPPLARALHRPQGRST